MGRLKAKGHALGNEDDRRVLLKRSSDSVAFNVLVKNNVLMVK